ncbi:MAG: prolyl oligopeptidase family serine peptidase, partial [Gemmataceae bacterium]
KVQAVCNWFGPIDLAQMSPPVAQDNPITKLLGGDTGTKKDLAKSANPITYIDKDDAPFLTIHGDKDSLVPHAQSELLHEALKKAKVPSQLIVIPGAGHGDEAFRKPLLSGEHKGKMLAFFDKHLKN